MFDYKDQVTEFLKQNFSPSSPEKSNFDATNDELLEYLFQVFPHGCISDYDLSEILTTLKFQRFVYTVDSIIVLSNPKNQPKEHISQRLCFGWCLFSEKLQKK